MLFHRNVDEICYLFVLLHSNVKKRVILLICLGQKSTLIIAIEYITVSQSAFESETQEGNEIVLEISQNAQGSN